MVTPKLKHYFVSYFDNNNLDITVRYYLLFEIGQVEENAEMSRRLALNAARRYCARKRCRRLPKSRQIHPVTNAISISGTAAVRAEFALVWREREFSAPMLATLGAAAASGSSRGSAIRRFAGALLSFP